MDDNKTAKVDAIEVDGSELNRRQFMGGVGGVAVGTLAGGLTGLAAVAGGSAAQATEYAPDTGVNRRNRAFQIRHQAALAEHAIGIPAHATNGDEELYPSRIGNFSKTLPHNEFGEVDPGAYQAFLDALQSGDFAQMEAVPRGGRLTFLNPLGGLAYNIEGPDSSGITVTPPPAIASPEWAAQMAELYWMAILRDVPFTNWNTDPLVQAACDDLDGMVGYTGPRDPVTGSVTPQVLFRLDYPGALDGPMVSQLLLRAFRYDGILVDPKQLTAPPGLDFVTHYPEWLDIQRGLTGPPVPGAPNDPVARYPRNVRDLGRVAGQDFINSQYFRGAIILSGIGIGVDLNNPYRTSLRQGAFSTFGASHLAQLIGLSHHSERPAWYHKWNVHRFLRPEGGGGRVHIAKTSQRSYPLHPDILDSPVLPLIFEYNRQQNVNRFGINEGSYLLPLMFTTGGPTHPSFPAGHAIAAGGGCTMLKAWFNEDQVWPNPVKASADGLSLVPYVVGVDGPPLTVGGELNKLCHNLSLGRDMSGVHWRADTDSGNFQGEEQCIRMLREQKATYPEPFAGFTLRKYNGEQIVV